MKIEVATDVVRQNRTARNGYQRKKKKIGDGCRFNPVSCINLGRSLSSNDDKSEEHDATNACFVSSGWTKVGTCATI